MKGRASIATAAAARDSRRPAPARDVDLAALRRRFDASLEERLLGEISVLGAESDRFRRLGELLDALAEADLAAAIEALFAPLRDLAGRPEDLPSRRRVLAAADALARSLNALSRRLDGLREAMDGDVRLAVDEVNRCAAQIAALNGPVAAAEASRDGRGRVLRELGERLAISAVETSCGDVNVLVGGAFLVLGTERGEVVALKDGAGVVVPVFASGGAALAVRGGRLGGLLDARDILLAGVARDLDRVAAGLAEGFRRIPSAGWSRLFSGSRAADLAVDPVLAGRPESLSGAPPLEGLPSILGGRTFGEFAGSLSGRLRGEAEAAQRRLETRALLARQTENRRAQTWDAGFDEVVARLLRDQRASQASERRVQGIDELLGSLLQGI